MEKLKNTFKSEKITTALAAVVIFILIGLIYQSNNTKDQIKSNTFSKEDIVEIKSKSYSLNSTLFPIEVDKTLFNKSNSEKLDQSKLSKESISIKTPVTKNSSTNSKLTPLPTPFSSPAEDLPEYISTVEARDKDRSLIGQLLEERLSEYYFHNNEYPNIYIDKSKTELNNTPVSKIYFYNADKNRTNAKALVLGDKDDTYLFLRVSSCKDRIPQENEFVFSLNGSTLEVCTESSKNEIFKLFE